MVIHALFPDSILKPVGGLGEQVGQIYYRLKDKVDFRIFGFPQSEELDGYTPVSNFMTQMYNGSFLSLTNQINYFYHSVKSKDKPDLIHAMDWSTYIAGHFAAKYWEVPLLVTMQLSVIGQREKGIFYCNDIDSYDGFSLHYAHEISEEIGLESADKIIHVSKPYAERFEEHKDKSVIIPNGIDLKFWEGKAKPFDFPGDRKHKLIYIGRFAEMKGILQLCQAKIPEDVDLYFIGDSRGGEQHCWKAVQQKCEEPNVHYLGFLRGEEKKSVMQSADAIIIPSIHEPFGIVGLEAMAAGSLIISSFVDGISEYLTDDIGLRISPTSESISSVLQDFVKMNKKDINKRVSKGLKEVQNYNWDKIADKYLNLYKSLV